MRATRESWNKLHGLPGKRGHLSIQRAFSEEAVELLRRGFIPEKMEDKWFIYYEDNSLYFYRSWTGNCIFEVHLVHTGAEYVIDSVLVNRDESQYTGSSDAYDTKLVTYLIDTLLLEERSPLPIAPGVPAGIEQDLYLQHMIGAGQRPPQQEVKTVTLWGAVRWFWRWLLWLIRR